MIQIQQKIVNKNFAITFPEPYCENSQVFLLSASIWLGLTDSSVESVFRTPEGRTTPWAHWKAGSPMGTEADSFKQNDCVLRVSGEHGYWRDEDCSATNYYICEGFLAPAYSSFRFVLF